MIYLTGPPTFITPGAYNQVFVDTLCLVHSHRALAALDDGKHSLLQLVCGGLKQTSVSPTWRVRERYKSCHCLMLLTIHAPILTKKAFTKVRKTDWVED